LLFILQQQDFMDDRDPGLDLDLSQGLADGLTDVLRMARRAP
jgi:hypothetical protein